MDTIFCATLGTYRHQVLVVVMSSIVYVAVHMPKTMSTISHLSFAVSLILLFLARFKLLKCSFLLLYLRSSFKFNCLRSKQVLFFSLCDRISRHVRISSPLNLTCAVGNRGFLLHIFATVATVAAVDVKLLPSNRCFPLLKWAVFRKNLSQKWV